LLSSFWAKVRLGVYRGGGEFESALGKEILNTIKYGDWTKDKIPGISRTVLKSMPHRDD
jgi:hypothetical protein